MKKGCMGWFKYFMSLTSDCCILSDIYSIILTSIEYSSIYSIILAYVISSTCGIQNFSGFCCAIFINLGKVPLVMTTLVACLSTGKGSWAQVLKIINSQEWENIFLVTNAFGKEKFACSKKVELIVVDADRQPLSAMIQDIKSALSGKINDLEVALNISSGTGKEHMAVIAALIKSGLGFRLIDANDDSANANPAAPGQGVVEI
jgi:hypothetical protein